jgi:hypothetical protein
MRTRLTAALLCFALGLGSAPPALADGAASTRNIILGAAAAAALYFTVSNNDRKKAESANDIRLREQRRRQAQYRAWYRWRNGSDPTNAQARQWYYNQFGESPA